MLKQAICRKRGKMRMAKSRLVLVFYMIGKVGDASFLDQSQSVVKKKKKKKKKEKFLLENILRGFPPRASLLRPIEVKTNFLNFSKLRQWSFDKMLIDWVNSGRTGKHLSLVHDVRTSLCSVCTSWPRAIHFTVRPSPSISTYYGPRFRNLQ